MKLLFFDFKKKRNNGLKLNMQHHWQREEKYLVVYHIFFQVQLTWTR